MKKTQAFVAACAFALVPFAATACGESYDRAEFIAELVDTGSVTDEQANCVADRVESDIGIDRLNSRGDLTTEEEELLTSAMIDCVLG